jgi:hypothetical protein
LRYRDRWTKGKNDSLIEDFVQVPSFDPEGCPRANGLATRSEAIPEREELAGMARGANPDGYRDRNDRY